MAASKPRTPGEKIRLLDRFRQMDEATRRKLMKFTGSGLLIMLFGFVLIMIGLVMNTGAYSAEGLLVGFGIIVVAVGIIRILIGFINPLAPSDMDVEAHASPPDLDDQLFGPE